MPMAGFLAHEWIANLVFQKLKRKNFITQSGNLDDYFFGAIAPDIRYIANSPRDITHKPFGNESLFEALKSSSTSAAFVAGYEVHLITDIAWSNDKKWLDESIYEHYKINPNQNVPKFTLYGLVDDYFQAEADTSFPLECSERVMRAKDTKILLRLSFTNTQILNYKYFLSIYFREPGVDTIINFDFFPDNTDEILIRKFLEDKTGITDYLREFKKVAVEKSVAALEKYL